MKRKVSKLRLSPNEEARIIREEQERRRKLRIQQVREQQKHISLQICREVERRRQHELQQLEQELREDWTRQQRDKLQTLQRLYEESLQLIGQGHRSAKENEPNLIAVAQREEENRAKAEERYREALKELKTQKIRDHDRQNQPINFRKKALQAEKERSAKVASLPLPLNPIQNVDIKPHVVRRCDLSAFAATHYHMLQGTVEREAEAVQPDAHREAELEARRLQELQEEEKRRREEQLEKARVRGRQALKREQLVQDRERLLVELEHLQQTDLLRRRQQVSQMPPQIFQPLYKRQESREDFQREMEFAFEDMYTGERRVKGDLVVQLVPEPLPAASTGSQDQELDVSLDETSRPEAEHVSNDTEREAGSSEQETSTEAEPPKPAPKRALRKLLDRIRNQRDEWVSGSSRVSDSPTVFTDQIPERDTSIESGSLSSEEKHKQTPIEAPECTIPPPAEELRDQPHVSLPDVLASKIQEFEEERNKREEELETEKQQQMFLLRELEEQKAKLEQMLLEAQQQREHLKAAAARETILNQAEEPARDQQVTPPFITQPAPPAGEDDHTSRVREYQQRLLEQNRVHQRSVEVARQRLEEYQRALQIRHSMTSWSLLPVVRPPSVVPLLVTQSDRRPAPLQLLAPPAAPAMVQNEPQTSEEDVMRHFEALAPPPCPAPCNGVGLKLQSDESVSDTLRSHRPDGNIYLTDNIMKKVTEHLPERLRASVSEPPPHKPFPSVSQSSADPLRAVSPRIPIQIPREDAERQRRGQEEERQRQEVEMEQMRRQKSTLQALIGTDELVSQPPREELDSEDVGQQRRRRLLVSLLKVIEESNGGTLSHLEDPEETDDSLQLSLSDFAETAPATQISGPSGPPQSSVLLSGLFNPPRAPKPPVTRVKLGFNEMTEQHELSAIQEVETPVNMSRVTGQDGTDSPAAGRNLQDGSESFVSSDGTLQSPSASSSGQRTAVGVSSETSGPLPRRERLLSGAGTSPERSDSGSVLKIISPLSFDSGRGADLLGPANSSYKSPSEPLRRPRESDGLSSTTISSGSYVSTAPEQNANTAEHKFSFTQESGAELSDVSFPGGRTLSLQETSAVGRSAPSLHSVFSDSNIQRIIDKYTRELNVSLNTAGTTTGRTTEGENVPSGTQRSVSDFDNTDHPNLESFTGENPSLPDQDSFRPLIGHLTDQSSYLAADQRESVLEQLVGQPSAHSSMIGPSQGPPVSLSFDQAGWDSTLSRMIGSLSHLSGSHWPSPGQDFDAGQLMGWMASESSWLDGGPEESRMRPLVGEPDETADQHSGSSGGSSRVVSAEDAPSEDSSRSAPVPGVAQHPQDQTSPVELYPHRTEDSDLFHPLEAADPSMTFHLPDHVSDTPSGSEPSPEQLRTDEPNRSLQESFSQLIAECPPQESILTASPSLKLDEEQSLTPCSATAAQRTSRPVAEGSTVSKDSDPVGEKNDQDENHFLPASEKTEAAAERGILEQSDITLVSLTDITLQEEVTAIMEEVEEVTAITEEEEEEVTAIMDEEEEVTAITEEEEEEVTAITEEEEEEEVTAITEEEEEEEVTAIMEEVEEVTAITEEEEEEEVTAIMEEEEEVTAITEEEEEEEVTAITEEEEEEEVTAITEEEVTAITEEEVTAITEEEVTAITEEEEEVTTITEEEVMAITEEEEEVTTITEEEVTAITEEEEEVTTITEEEEEVTTITEEEILSEAAEHTQTEKLDSSSPKETPGDSRTRSGTVLEFQWGPSTHLQNVFRLKRTALLQRSSGRLEEIKAKAARAKTRPRSQGPVKDTEAQQDSRTEGGRAARNKLQLPSSVCASSPNKEELQICTAEQRKRHLSVMHKRTQRLYEQLEEVKLQRAARSRQEDHAKNRLKAKEFHQKTLQKLRAKQTRQ